MRACNYQKSNGQYRQARGSLSTGIQDQAINRLLADTNSSSGKEIMDMQHIDPGNQYALRIEGRDWMDDLTLEQVWFTLKSAYQQVQEAQDLLFIILFPNGEMPARCLPKAMFEFRMSSPAMLSETLASDMPGLAMLPEASEFTEE